MARSRAEFKVVNITPIVVLTSVVERNLGVPEARLSSRKPCTVSQCSDLEGSSSRAAEVIHALCF